MEKHDLFYFFQEANSNIESEYKRICASASEDPGTAGDQGEENWKRILEQWLPPYFHIETKGRILFEDGTTSPQVDIIVLSPEYPKQLWGCKRYLSGGVVAAFECKTTLRRKYIQSLMQTSRIIREKTIDGGWTPRKDLQSRIYYGMLAHSHEWKSNPKEVITNSIIEFDQQEIQHPKQMPDAICVADLAVWRSTKYIIPKQQDEPNPLFDHNSVRTGYIVTKKETIEDNSLYTPIGAMVFDLLDHLAWNYPRLRNIVEYMRRLNVNGAGRGSLREWTWDVLSFATREEIQKGRLKQGKFWDEWSMIQ